MTTPENSGTENLNTSTSAADSTGQTAGTACATSCVSHKAFWLASLAVIGTGLALHGALAYSPELANYVPESVVSSNQTQCPLSMLMGKGGSCSARSSCQSSQASCSQQMSGCCSSGISDFMVELSADSEPVDVTELPADALAPAALDAN